MSDLEPETFDAQKRRLCPDGSCVGLLDPEGRCRACGRVNAAGDAPDTLLDYAGSPALADDIAAWENGPDGPNSGHHTGEHVNRSGSVGGQFDPTRRLCPDGDCVGVLDAQGRCKECGRTDASAKPVVG